MSWPSVKLGECVEIVSGATPSTSVKENWDGDIFWATPKDLSGLNNKNISATDRCITKKGLNSCSARILPKNSVLFSSRAPIGLVAINTVPMATNQGFKSFIPKPNILSEQYLYYWLKNNREDINRMGVGATFKEVSKTIVSKIIIPLPPLEEQKRIASILDKAELVKRKRELAIDRLNELSESIFQKMFNDPVINSFGWLKCPLSLIVDGKYGVKAGPFGSSLKKEEYTDKGYRVYGQEQVIAGSFEVGNYFISEEKYGQLQSYAIKPGDILVSLVGSFGKVIVVPDNVSPGIINPRLLKITPNIKIINPYFLAEVLKNKSIQKRLIDLAHGGTMGILNAGILKLLEIIIPPLDLQKEYVEILFFLKEKRESYFSSQAKLQNLSFSIQQKAFSGQLKK